MLARKTLTIRTLTSLAVLLSVFSTGAQSTDEEYRVKAAFLFHFAQLVDWPDNAPEAASNSLAICTLGGDPFQGALEHMVAGKTIGPRTLEVHHLKQVEETPGCQILFLDKALSKPIPEVIAVLHNAPILTVGETTEFLQAGGMICFVLDESNVRFQINLDAARAARLKIGSRLLFHAQAVIGDTKTGETKIGEP